MYANALKVAPPPTHWPANLKPHLEHAQRVVERDRGEYGAHLERALADAQAKLPPGVAGRWREAASIMAGRTQPYHQHCNQLHIPRLPEIPFHDRSNFPWLAAIEAKTDVIRAELLAALESDRDKFSPYITYNPGDPVNQWQELNHSLRWSVLKLWAGGQPDPANIERCPETAKAIAALPLVDIEGLCPNAMFSALAPKTRIPPHHGETNARLVAHLPLIVPEKCVLRVGYETREWKVGEVLILDDTIEHEAINDSDELRVVLIFDCGTRPGAGRARDGPRHDGCGPLLHGLRRGRRQKARGPAACATGPRVRPGPEVDQFGQESVRFNMTRRFCWRPSAVSFEAIGFASPKPCDFRRDGSTPRDVR